MALTAANETDGNEEEEDYIYNDSALDDPIEFFRVKQRYEFDSDESITNATWTQAQIDSNLGVPANWVSSDPNVYIYIDDANGVEKVRVPGSIVHVSERRQKIQVHTYKSEELMRNVTVKAESMGMRVNGKK